MAEVHPLPRSLSGRRWHYKKETRKLTLSEEVQLVRQRLRSGNRFVVDPNTKAMRRWDMATSVALFLTAVVTPVEVAFLDTRFDTLFFVNRVVDAVFVADMVLQFFLAYYDSTRGNILIKNRRLIARRYVSSWCLIDLVSSFPFELVAVFGDTNEAVKQLRLLRLLKLARVARIQRIQARWEVYASFSVSYATLGVYKLSILLLLFAHWSACLWGIAANPSIVGESAWTWIRRRRDYLVDGSGKPLFRMGSAKHTYTAALYFAIYTMTGIGYGDLTPTTQHETSVCVLIMAVSAVFWAFMIGSFCNVVSSMNAQESQFRQRMDDLNYMMADRKFPPALQRRCRMFLINSKQHQRAAGYHQLENLFSISLRGDVAATINEEWIKKLWYLEGASKDFIIELSQSLTSIMFAPMEAIDICYALFILQNGIVARQGKILAKGSLWGCEFIMSDEALIDTTCAAALSYTLVMCICRDDFFAILEDPVYVKERKAVAAADKFYKIKMRILKLASDASKNNKLKLTSARNAPARAQAVADALKQRAILKRASMPLGMGASRASSLNGPPPLDIPTTTTLATTDQSAAASSSSEGDAEVTAVVKTQLFKSVRRIEERLDDLADQIAGIAANVAVPSPVTFNHLGGPRRSSATAKTGTRQIGNLHVVSKSKANFELRAHRRSLMEL